MADIFGIAPRDKTHYARVIQRERALANRDVEPDTQPAGTAAVMIVTPPDGWTPGKCVGLGADVRYPFCYEISIVGYPGFGTLDTLRGRLHFDPLFDPDTDEPDEKNDSFEFSRTATNAQIVRALPKWWRDRCKVTGGYVVLDQTTVENPDWVDPATNPPQLPVPNPREITTEQTVFVGRWLIGFEDEPAEFVFAETEGPTDAELITLVGYDENGELNAPPLDENGFSTNYDPRVTVRTRKCTFLASSLPRDIVTLVDTSQPTPIAAGALAYASEVAAIGLSILSVEPRVFQNLNAVEFPEVEA